MHALFVNARVWVLVSENEWPNYRSLINGDANQFFYQQRHDNEADI